MTQLRRLPTLATMAIVLAACGTGATPSPSNRGAETASPPSPTAAAPSPTRSFPALPSFTPIPSPDGQPWGCPAITPDALATIDVVLGSIDARGNGGAGGISLGRIDATLPVISVTERSGQQRSFTPPPPEVSSQRGQILGGHEFVAFPFTDFSGHVNPQAMDSAIVTLTFEGGSPIQLLTRFIPGNANFDQVAVAVPDGAGPASLTLDFVWADPCFVYRGKKTIAVDVVPRSTTDGCVLETPGYYEQVGELLKGSLRVGSATVRASSPVNEGKFGPFVNEGIDAGIVYAFDPKEGAVVAQPGSTLRIEKVSPDITLGKDMRLWVWTRASVTKAVEDYPPDGTVLVLSRTPVMQADGTFRLQVPEDPGRYVAGVELTYDAQCSSGTLWFVVNIDVEA